MTVAAQTPQIDYAGDGSTTAFPVPFRYRDPSHLRARIVLADGSESDPVNGSDFTAGAGDTDAGGTLTFAAAPAAGATVAIWRETPRVQETDYTTTGAFKAESHEAALDERAMTDQEQDREIARAVKAPRGEIGIELAPLADRDGKFAAFAGGKLVGDDGTPQSSAALATLAANSNAAAVAARDETLAARDDTAALAAAASNPDANTQAALTASQQALDAVAAYEGAFDASSTALPADLSSRVKHISLNNAKAHDYCVSLYKFTSTNVQINIFDEQIGDEVGFLQIASVDYSALAGVRWPIVALDPLSTLPAGDPDGANPSPILGYVEFFDTITATGTTLQPAPGAARINRRNVKKQQLLFSKHPADDYDEVIEAGSVRDLATPRAACDLFLDVPQPTDQTGAYAPQSKRTIGKRVAILVDPADPNSPGLPWYDRHLFLPPRVSFVARFPGSVFFEHSPGSTRPILQLTDTHDLVDINVKSTVADSPIGPTASACYAMHIEEHHLRVTAYPQSTFDYTQHYRVRMIGGSAVAGNAATIQPIGGAIPVNTLVEFDGVDLDADNAAFVKPLISMNNSSLTMGGGRLRVRRCRDLSGRDQSNAANAANASVAVQTKADFPYPNLLELDGNLNFGKIALSGFGAGGAGGAGSWKLQGGDWQGIIHSTIPGDTMGYV